jgi:hypothetical protein
MTECAALVEWYEEEHCSTQWKSCPIATPAINPMWTGLGLNLSHHSDGHCLNCGMAQYCCYSEYIYAEVLQSNTPQELFFELREPCGIRLTVLYYIHTSSSLPYKSSAFLEWTVALVVHDIREVS